MKRQKKYVAMIIIAMLVAAVPTYAAPIKNADKHITVGTIKGFNTQGELAPITIEEPEVGSFKSDKVQYLKLELKSTGIQLNYDKGEILKDVLIGKKAYAGKRFSAKVISQTSIEIEIPAKSLDSKEKGELELKGIQVKATDGAPYGQVKVSLKGDLVDNVELTLANYSDYGTEVKVAKTYTAIAGQKLEDVEITLSELVPASLQGQREVEFVFPEGITIDSVKISKSEGLKKGKETPVITIAQEKDKNTNIFRVSSIEGETDQSISITFKVTLDIPTSITKDIVLLIDGAALEKDKEILVANVKAPVEIEVIPARVKVGLANQTGGKITLTETDDYIINKGKIFLAIEESTMKYTKAPKVEVTKGDLRVEDEATIVEGGLEVTILSKSTEPSTLVISGGEITVDRTVPDGTFYVKVGGPALSAFSADTLWNVIDQKHNNIDAIAQEGFIMVGDVDEPIKEANTASFKIGQATYTVNGQEETMDTVPYIADSKIMLPVRYVADALGIEASQIKWDLATQTVTVIGDRVVQIKLGEKEMIVDKVVVPMATNAAMQNDRVFVPVAEIANALGAAIHWDGPNKIATFN